MYFDSLTEFLQMGKHGFYVWLAYGTTGLVLLWSWWSAQKGFADTTKQLMQRAELAARAAANDSESGKSHESET